MTASVDSKRMNEGRSEKSRASIRQRLKRTHHTLTWGRGVTAAQQTFNLHGVGSSPSGPTFWRVAQR